MMSSQGKIRLHLIVKLLPSAELRQMQTFPASIPYSCTAALNLKPKTLKKVQISHDKQPTRHTVLPKSYTNHSNFI